MGNIGKLKRILEILPAESPEARLAEEHRSSSAEEELPVPASQQKDRARD